MQLFVIFEEQVGKNKFVDREYAKLKTQQESERKRREAEENQARREAEQQIALELRIEEAQRELRAGNARIRSLDHSTSTMLSGDGKMSGDELERFQRERREIMRLRRTCGRLRGELDRLTA